MADQLEEAAPPGNVEELVAEPRVARLLHVSSAIAAAVGLVGLVLPWTSVVVDAMIIGKEGTLELRSGPLLSVTGTTYVVTPETQSVLPSAGAASLLGLALVAACVFLWQGARRRYSVAAAALSVIAATMAVDLRMGLSVPRAGIHMESSLPGFWASAVAVAVLLAASAYGVFVKRTTPHTPPPPPAPGFSGWLLCAAGGLALVPISELSKVILLATNFPPAHSSAVSFASASLMVGLGMCAFSCLVAVQFSREKASAPKLIVTLLVINVVAQAFLLLPAYAAHQASYDASRSAVALLAATTPHQFVMGVLLAGICIPYVRMSKRVKATFVRY